MNFKKIQRLTRTYAIDCLRILNNQNKSVYKDGGMLALMLNIDIDTYHIEYINTNSFTLFHKQKASRSFEALCKNLFGDDVYLINRNIVIKFIGKKDFLNKINLLKVHKVAHI